MYKVIALFLLCCFSSFWSFGQEGTITSGPETIAPLRVNAELKKRKGNVSTTLAKSPGSQFYFVLDTLSLPFMDDFSTYTLKSYDTLDYNSNAVVDSFSIWFTVDGIPVDTFTCVADTTFSYIISNVDSSVISKTFLTEYEIVYYNDAYNPYVPTDISYCWSPFEVFDTIILPSSPDTLSNLGIIIDTLVNVFDTLKVYPPDTLSGGKSQSLWIDEHVFINNRYPIDPPTLGVATFDGLDESGTPYNGFSDPGGYGVADYLTSKPIDLSYVLTDSVFISFYYQPEGIGNDPQAEDSLVLEFYAPETRTWHHAWSIPGRSFQNFRHVILHISDIDYLKNGFQFRFKNYATISGAFDHWHVDYVRIDKDRNESDSIMLDVGIVSATTSIFRNYESVPWKHYLANNTLLLDTPMAVHMHNFWEAPNFCGYKYSIHHNDGVLDSTFTWPSGTNQLDVPANGELSRTTFMEYYFDWSSESDSAVFEITSFLIPNTNKDTIRKNDTLRYLQRFYNYYAYDDGTAEGSYGLSVAGGKLAYKFTNIKSDTLRAIDIYFAQSEFDQSEEEFYLTVWSSLAPENIVYQGLVERPEYEDSLNEFHTYILDEIVVLSGTYYIGWLQDSDEILGVGIDLNNDVDAKRYYNSSGTWLQSLLGGAIMMRPLFGDTVMLPLAVEEPVEFNETFNQFNVYPNPANELIRIEVENHYSNNKSFQVIIVDLYGREVVSETKSTGLIDIRHLADGIYFVKVKSSQSVKYETKKIFVSH